VAGGDEKSARTNGGEVPAISGSAPALREREEAESSNPYLTSRIASRTGQLAGARKISMLSSGLATLGLGFLKTRGREKTGAALLATAAGLALMKRG
jgi:hypothetical protein